MKQQLGLQGKPAVGLFLMALLLLQLTMAAWEPLHKFFHRDADQPGHECAVTMLAHGHVDASAVDEPFILPVAGIETTPRVLVSFFSATVKDLPPSRGPPAFCFAS